jgi:hypothetical protein
MWTRSRFSVAGPLVMHVPQPSPDVVPLPPSPHPVPPPPQVPPEIIDPVPPGGNEPVRDPVEPGPQAPPLQRLPQDFAWLAGPGPPWPGAGLAGARDGTAALPRS